MISGSEYCSVVEFLNVIDLYPNYHQQPTKMRSTSRKSEKHTFVTFSYTNGLRIYLVTYLTVGAVLKASVCHYNIPITIETIFLVLYS